MTRRTTTSGCLIVIFLVAFSSCSSDNDGTTLAQKYANAFRDALGKLETQMDNTISAYSEAEKARGAAHEISFKYRDPRTEAFIRRWSQAELEAKSLQDRIDSTIEAADFFLVYCEYKAQSIHDIALRSRTVEAVETKRNQLIPVIRRVIDGKRPLDQAMQNGRDLISAIEVSGALQEVTSKSKAFDLAIAESLRLMPELKALLEEGRELLDAEMKPLE